ncbi:transcriptional regulator, XRE family [Pseudovibrio denitrificans]|uniref:Transcriptional regulator, XRE family n=1 Tax=Pseudovibrio denitrificans TaxID=258256 RepID=A0A1I7DZL7_9HYPH|nr:helix-turn-helix domain-containing protein [Pseudovibrio denitrificans]SFU17073.1 transcriptional regulator, XRE family [Pseudovibrio denitrificans]
MKQLARTPKDIGHAIRQARKALKLTQKELANRSGVWQETISKIENDVGGTKIDTIFDLLAALDLEIQIQPRTKGMAIPMDELF